MPSSRFKIELTFSFMNLYSRVSDASLIRFVDPGLVDTGADVTVIRDLEWPNRCGFQLGVCDQHLNNMAWHQGLSNPIPEFS
ncbi:unnamed protein product [Caretta caretta]